MGTRIVVDRGAERDRFAGGASHVVDVKVEMTAAPPVVDALYAEIGVAVRRYQRGELPCCAARGRQGRIRCGQPEPGGGVERRRRSVDEGGQPAHLHERTL